MDQGILESYDDNMLSALSVRSARQNSDSFHIFTQKMILILGRRNAGKSTYCNTNLTPNLILHATLADVEFYTQLQKEFIHTSDDTMRVLQRIMDRQLKFGSAKTWTIVVEHCESLLPSTLLLDLCAHDRHYNIQLVIVLQVEDVLESEAPKKEIERVREFLHNVIPQADEIVTCGVLPSWTDRMISRLRQSWEQLHGAANSSEPTQA
jgi:hypothetical protein